MKVTRFDLLKQCDIELASKLIYALGRKFDKSDELKVHLLGPVTKQELQRINDAAHMEGYLKAEDTQWEKDLNKAHKWNKQAKILSLCALLISIMSLFIKIFEELPLQ